MGHDGGRPGTGATALTSGDEDHVGPVQRLADVVLVVLGRLAPDAGVGPGTQATGQVAANVELGVGVGHEEGLSVRVHGNELDATQTGLDHAVDGVDATAADAHHLDDCLVVLRFRHCVPPSELRATGAPPVALNLEPEVEVDTYVIVLMTRSTL